MENDQEADPCSLQELLKRIEQAAEPEQQRVPLGTITERIGHRSFGALLLLAGLITLAPFVGDIPGIPTLMGVLVILVSGQMLLGREAIWLPDWLMRRSVSADRVRKASDWARKPARIIDRLLRPRLGLLLRGPGRWIAATACLLVGLALPPMELIPFSANLGGAALTGLGLALTADDGLFALLSYGLIGAAAAVLLWQF